MVARVFTTPGRGFCLRLKRESGRKNLVFQLEPATQGCWLSDDCQEIEKNSPLVRSIQRLLINGRIIGVALVGAEDHKEFDRVLKIHVAVIDHFFGNRTDFFLICEFTGRVANIFLCDDELKIIERFAVTSNNSIGSIYQLPDSNYLLNPFTTELAEIEEVFSSHHKTWSEKIGILSPQVAKELARRTLDEKSPASLARELKVIIEANCGDPLSYLVVADNKVKSLTGYSPSFTEGVRTFSSVGDALDFVDREVVGNKRFDQARNSRLNHYQKELAGKQALIKAQEKLKAEYENSGHLQKIGNLIIANMYQITPGTAEVILDDWETGEKVEIVLDPLKSVQSQAQKFFHQYKKARRGILEVEKRIAGLRTDVKWLQEQIWLIENASGEGDLPEIETKVVKMRRSKTEKSGGKRRKYHFQPLLEIDGCRYYVGKNGRQNDILTFHIGKKNDRWFHANDVPGAHVVMKKAGGDVQEVDLVRGAILAAWFSFAKDSSKVAVDTTEVAWVKKIPGGGVGRVSYTNQTTVFVNPQDAEELLKKIQNRETENTGE